MLVDFSSEGIKNKPLGEWEVEPEDVAKGGVDEVVPFAIPRWWPEGYVLNEWGLKEDVPHEIMHMNPTQEAHTHIFCPECRGFGGTLITPMPSKGSVTCRP